MQQNAQELDHVRAESVRNAEDRDRADREADEAARAESSKYGERGAFVSGMNRRAGDMDLADRLRRGKRNIEKGQEAC